MRTICRSTPGRRRRLGLRQVSEYAQWRGRGCAHVRFAIIKHLKDILQKQNFCFEGVAIDPRRPVVSELEIMQGFMGIICHHETTSWGPRNQKREACLLRRLSCLPRLSPPFLSPKSDSFRNAEVISDSFQQVSVALEARGSNRILTRPYFWFSVHPQ